MKLLRSFALLGFLLVLSPFLSLGCGGDPKDPATPSQVTKEMEEQAKASDNFMMEQMKTKKAAPSK